VVDRHELYLKVQLERGFDQPATGSSRAAEKICTIEFQEKPPGFTMGLFLRPVVVLI
jgi:hypothetical protein